MDIAKLIKKFAGQWVALNEDSTKVVASGKNAKTVYNEAKKVGFDTPKLFKVPLNDLPYIGNAI